MVMLDESMKHQNVLPFQGQSGVQATTVSRSTLEFDPLIIRSASSSIVKLNDGSPASEPVSQDRQPRLMSADEIQMPLRI